MEPKRMDAEYKIKLRKVDKKKFATNMICLILVTGGAVAVFGSEGSGAKSIALMILCIFIIEAVSLHALFRDAIIVISKTEVICYWREKYEIAYIDKVTVEPDHIKMEFSWGEQRIIRFRNELSKEDCDYIKSLLANKIRPDGTTINTAIRDVVRAAYRYKTSSVLNSDDI